MPTDAWRYELGTKGSVVELGLAAHDAGMLKRVLAALLWFYAGWYGGALLADFLGASQLLGPIIGATSAALVAGDPRRIIWTARSAGNPPSSQEPAVDPV